MGTRADKDPPLVSLHQDRPLQDPRVPLVEDQGSDSTIKQASATGFTFQHSNFSDVPHQDTRNDSPRVSLVQEEDGSDGGVREGVGCGGVIEGAGCGVTDSITSQYSNSIDGPHSFDSPGAHVPHSLDVGTSLAVDGGVTDAISAPESQNKDAVHTSAAAFVQGGIQDACDDACSICLESFCDNDPATVTFCKHEYHLQCILEWAQRSKDCPMCWQPLSFEDPNSQELFEAVEQERSSMHSLDGIQFHQVPAFANYADFEERIMQHLAHQLARRGALQRRTSAMHDDAFVHPSSHPLFRTTRAILEQPVPGARDTYNQSFDGSSQSHISSETGSHETGRQSVSPGTAEEGQQRTGASDISSLSESLKSRLLVASSKWKETLTRTTHGFKERWRARSNSTADFRARAQEVSADVVRQAIKKIAPDSIGKDTHGAASSSSSPSSVREGDGSVKDGTCPESKCTTDNHLEGVATNVVSHQHQP